MTLLRSKISSEIFQNFVAFSENIKFKKLLFFMFFKMLLDFALKVNIKKDMWVCINNKLKRGKSGIDVGQKINI